MENAQVCLLWRLVLAIERRHCECCTPWPCHKFSISNFWSCYVDKSVLEKCKHCVVLCCAVLCCAVLCCVVLCWLSRRGVNDDCSSHYRVISSVYLSSCGSEVQCALCRLDHTRYIWDWWWPVLMVVEIELLFFFPLFLGSGIALIFKHVGSILHGASPFCPFLSSGLSLVGVYVADW